MSVELRVLTHGASYFVGFHDVTPWNAATGELLCLRTEVEETHAPDNGETAEVVVLSEDGGARSVGRTTAWNWQKGARQCFLPAVGRRVVAFNVATETGFGCRLVDLDGGADGLELCTLPRAVYDFAPSGVYGLALDMAVLFRLQPGYGYAHPRLDGAEAALPGIWRVDLAEGTPRNILPLDAFLADHGIDPGLGRHYFTHVQIAPDSRHFAFMHRCFLESGALVNNLVVADAVTGENKIVHDDKMSHFDWEDADRLVVWCRQNAAVKALKQSRLKAIIRPLYLVSRSIRSPAVRQSMYNEAFRRIDLRTGRKVVLGRGVLTEDGHPQVRPGTPSIWICDTYPTREHEQTLYLFDSSSGRRRDLLTLPTQPAIQETIWRCDLHPRWNPAGDKVCVDSAHLGRRQICVLSVSEDLAALGVTV